MPLQARLPSSPQQDPSGTLDPPHHAGCQPGPSHHDQETHHLPECQRPGTGGHPGSARQPLRLRPLRPLLHLRQGRQGCCPHQPRPAGTRRGRDALRLHRPGRQRGRLRRQQLHLQRHRPAGRRRLPAARIPGAGPADRPQPGRCCRAGRGPGHSRSPGRHHHRRTGRAQPRPATVPRGPGCHPRARRIRRFAGRTPVHHQAPVPGGRGRPGPGQPHRPTGQGPAGLSLTARRHGRHRAGPENLRSRPPPQELHLAGRCRSPALARRRRRIRRQLHRRLGIALPGPCRPVQQPRTQGPGRSRQTRPGPRPCPRHRTESPVPAWPAGRSPHPGGRRTRSHGRHQPGSRPLHAAALGPGHLHLHDHPHVRQPQGPAAG